MLKGAALIAIIICIVLLITGCQNPVHLFLNWLKDGGDASGTEKGDTPFPEEGESPGETDGTPGMKIRDTVLYYRDSDGYLVPMSVDIEWEEGIAGAALARIIADDENSEISQQKGLYSAIPAGAKILGLTIRDGLAKVDLSAEALNYNSVKEEDLMLKSILYTLTEFNTVDRVQFMFEGDVAETLRFGTDVGGFLNREGINTIGEGGESEVTVYFHRTNEKGYRYFVPITLDAGTEGTDMGIAVKCLLEGPPEGSDLQSSIPKGVTINGMGTKNGIAYLNFEEGIFDYEGGDSIAENIVKSVALTLKEYPTVTGVVFLVEGQPAALPTGVVLESVIDVPVFANE